MSMSKIKVGDTVRIIAGKDKGREGKVLRIDHKAGRLTVEGANMITKHNKQSAKNPTGGIMHLEGAIDASNVMVLVDGKPTRVGYRMDGDKKVRYAKKSGEEVK